MCGDLGSSRAVLRRHIPRSTDTSVPEPGHVCSVSTDHGASQEVNRHVLAVAEGEIGVPTTSTQAHHQSLPANGYQGVNGY